MASEQTTVQTSSLASTQAQTKGRGLTQLPGSGRPDTCLLQVRVLPFHWEPGGLQKWENSRLTWSKAPPRQAVFLGFEMEGQSMSVAPK